MIDLKPIFFSSGTASGVVAPPQATVVSSWAKLVTPGTVCLVTCCAAPAATPHDGGDDEDGEQRRHRISCMTSFRNAALIILRDAADFATMPGSAGRRAGWATKMRHAAERARPE